MTTAGPPSLDPSLMQPLDAAARRALMRGGSKTFVAASLLAWLGGYLLNDVVQNTVLRMRSDVEDKVHRQSRLGSDSTHVGRQGVADARADLGAQVKDRQAEFGDDASQFIADALQ